MTNDRMALAEPFEKGSDGDSLREMIGYVWPRPRELDVAGLVGADHGERAESHENGRNRYRDRNWHTRSGMTALRMPKLRRRYNLPEFLEPRHTTDKALAAVGHKAYEQGISTRSVQGLVKAPGMASEPSEAEPFWTAFLHSLTRRGLRGAKPAISDARKGLRAAVPKARKSSWQRRWMPFLRSAPAYANKGPRQIVFALINTILAVEAPEADHTPNSRCTCQNHFQSKNAGQGPSGSPKLIEGTMS